MEFWKGLTAVNANHTPDYLSYFWGEYSSKRFFWYFPACLLLKNPTAALALIVFASVCLRKKHWRQVGFLLIPTLCLLVPTMLLADNIGVRYVIPIWTLLSLLAGVLGTFDAPWPALRSATVPVLLILCWATTLWAYPNYIPYFNLLAGGSEGGLHYLDDSNVDWGQDIPAAVQYHATCQDTEPRIFWAYSISPIDYGARAVSMEQKYHEFYFPVSTCYLISAQMLDRPEVPWLRWFKPAHVINDSIYVYRFRLTDAEPSSFDATNGINIVNEHEQYLRALNELDASPYIDKGRGLPILRSQGLKRFGEFCFRMRSYGLKRFGEFCIRKGLYKEALQAFGALKMIPGMENEGAKGEATVKSEEAKQHQTRLLLDKK